MIITGLSATGFMRFRTFGLQGLPSEGLIGIFGDNECGKSSIGELICFALFGRTPKSPEGLPEHLIRWGEDRADVTLEFTLADGSYGIRRSLHRDGAREATLEGPGGRVITDHPDDTDLKIPEILGFGFREFRYSTYIAQKELDIILHSADDRRVVLNNMLGVGFMERMSRKVGGKRIEKESEIRVFKRRLEDKREVLDVYMARGEDLQRLEERVELVNRQLLTAIRERDHSQSTLSLLSEIRAKREKFDTLDHRIKTRRELLKKIEADAAALIRESDSIPRLQNECKEKEKLIEQIRETHIPRLERDIESTGFHRELKARLEDRKAALRAKEKAFAENSQKMDSFRLAEAELESAQAEITSINNFMERYGGEQRLRMLITHLGKDVDLLRSETEKVRLSHRKDYDSLLERERLLTGQLDRLTRQMETTELEPVDVSELAQNQASELQCARRRDISLAFGGSTLLVGLVLPLALSAPLFLLIMLAAMPAAGSAFYFQGRVRVLRQKSHTAQQQSYAYTIAQRGINELHESEEEIRASLQKLSIEKESLQAAHEALEKIRIDSFAELDQTVEAIGARPPALLDRVHAQSLEILRDYEPLRTLLGAGVPFGEIQNFDVAGFIDEKQNGRATLEERVAGLRKTLEGRTETAHAREIIVRDMEVFQQQVSTLQTEVDEARIKEEDEARLRVAVKEANLQVEQLRREIEQNKAEERRIRSEADRAREIDARRRALIKELDEDMIHFYELREATRDIDVSEARFAQLTQRLAELEREVSELTGVIGKLDMEKGIVRKDLDRVEKVRAEIESIRASIRSGEADILKYRELETLYLSTGQSIRRRLIPQIEAYFAWILPKMTRGRYHRVRLGDDFDIQVFSQEKNDFVPLSVLSGGTIDQLLISLRLAFARAATASTQQSQYLFLDEPFSSFDASRRALFFSLLETLKATFQQIFLISHLPNLEESTDHYLRVTLNDEKQPALTSWA